MGWNPPTNADAGLLGPSSSTDNAVARFDGTTGEVLQNSALIVDDSGNVSGVAALTTTGGIELGHASDTTLSRSAAGVLAVEGVDVLTAGSNDIYSLGSLADNTATGGKVVRAGTGTLTLGKVYQAQTDGSWALADASAEATAIGLVGIALGTSPTTHGLLVGGAIDAAAALLAGWNEGLTLYLSETAGELTVTAPSTSGAIVRVMGYCLFTSAEILYSPDGAWVEVA